MSPLTLGLLVAASLFAGTVDAIAGGGGLITLPALLSAGLPPDLALGTNKGQSVWGSFASMLAFLRAGRVDKKQALVTFPLAIAGSFAGAAAVQQIAPGALRPIVIAMLVGAAVLIAIRQPDGDTSGPSKPVMAAMLALVIGVYDGFFGPGTGTFLIVGFVALCGRRLVDASADAKVVNFGSNLAAVIVFAANGRVIWDVALPMAAGQLCGGIIGARLTIRGGARIVRAMVLVASGALVVNLVREMI